MKKAKRLVAASIAAAALFTSVLAAPQARAVSMTTSDKGVAFIKEFEGFRSRVYWDGGTAYIGYGTSVRSSDYPSGISEAKAEALMRDALKIKEDPINSFLTENNIHLTQAQFDALLSFTYNIGTEWMDSDYRLYNYLKQGISNYSDVDIVDAMGAWCHMGGEIVSQLVTRRVREAKIFLYGDYAGTGPHDFKYVTFDAGSGSVENSIQFFEYGKSYGAIQTATRSGYTFNGWYTSGGTLISPATTVSSNLSVSAAWVDGVAPALKTGFSDVSSTDWFYNYVTDLSSAQIVTGYPDGNFHPSDTVSCGVALKLILLAAGFTAQPATGSNWASGYLTLALSKRLVDNGDIGNLDETISRLAIAEIAAKALGLPPVDTGETTFKDTTDGFVLALYHSKIITGTSDAGGLVFRPNSSITRAEISAIIWRITNSGIIQN